MCQIKNIKYLFGFFQMRLPWENNIQNSRHLNITEHWATKEINNWFVTDEFVHKDLPTKDVPLKYEKSGGTVWVSLDQFKSSPEKVSIQPNTSQNKAPSKSTKVSSSNLQNSTNYMASQEKPSPLSFHGDTS